MQVVPAIDILNGDCVRLTQGKRDKVTIYSNYPVEMAKHWQNEGAKLIHVVDLDGAFSGKPKNLATLEAIAKAVTIPVQFGGGVRDLATISECFNKGAARVVLGTAALRERRLVERATKEHQEKILLAIDAFRGFLAVQGWQEITGVKAQEFAASFESLPLAGMIYTDVIADGTLTGPNIPAIEELARSLTLPLFAAGGIGSLEDVLRLKAITGLAGAILGKVLYSGALSLREAIEASL
ncbi:MAG: 1-(5-phosphoribosyl)-5-[(5-phosphoribosylamino)methylideneamino]imidazole-4-carboxamide isomerase [Thermodesulfobacteriota bacterium]